MNTTNHQTILRVRVCVNAIMAALGANSEQCAHFARQGCLKQVYKVDELSLKIKLRNAK